MHFHILIKNFLIFCVSILIILFIKFLLLSYTCHIWKTSIADNFLGPVAIHRYDCIIQSIGINKVDKIYIFKERIQVPTYNEHIMFINPNIFLREVWVCVSACVCACVCVWCSVICVCMRLFALEKYCKSSFLSKKITYSPKKFEKICLQ